MRVYFRTGWFFAAPDNVAVQAAYGLANLSASWTDPSGRASIKAWSKNLGSTYYSTGLVESDHGIVTALGAPRTYGLTLGYRF